MSKTFSLPDLGEGIHEGEVLAVKVKPGQHVNEDDIILEIETDKAAVEIPSPYSEVVTQVNIKAGDTVHVGDVLLVFGGKAGSTPAAEASEPARPSGKAAVTSAKQSVITPYGEGPVPAAPSTRRLARELNVNLREVPASGPGGRVTAEDVRAFAAGPHPAKDTQKAEPTQGVPAVEQIVAPALPDFERKGGTTSSVERLPLRSVRRATAKQMALAWSQIPHVATQDLADITRLESLRRRYKDEVREQGGALTLTVFVLKALTHALKTFPKFNASLDMQAEEIVLKHYYDIGVAVDSERGLLVPVLRDVDRKTVFELAVELRELAERTREGKASLEELKGSSFTVTNVGALGGTGFTPIINYPEVAILGLAQARIQPVAVEKPLAERDPNADWTAGYTFEPRLMLPLVLSFDHRVNDGAEAQRFLNHIIEQLENPERLLLGM